MVSKTRVTKIKCLAEPRQISARILRCFHQVKCYNFELPDDLVTMRCLSVPVACYFWMSSTILSTVSFIHLLSIISITVTYAKFVSHSRNINSGCFQWWSLDIFFWDRYWQRQGYQDMRRADTFRIWSRLDETVRDLRHCWDAGVKT